jgi:hypothetical protein
MNIQSALIANNDPYTPAESIPSLQQYNPYQIYDMHCVDIVYSQTTNDNPPTTFIDKHKSWLAVQAFDPTGSIPCNFAQIVLNYP